MDLLDENLPLEFPLSTSSNIKVIGVGGAGGNAVNHMYEKGIRDVAFVVCNTDEQDLKRSPVPVKILLGKETTRGLGAGAAPAVATKAAEESREEIEQMLSDNTDMVFITAGMGGGTGTGAAPIIAQIAQSLDILTVGIVTIPFAFEGKKKILQALEGVASLSRFVDAILVINNEKLRQIHSDFEISNAFAKADDILSNAAKAIAEIITVPGYVNTDFADVNTIMKNGKVAIMNTGFASGENRINKAIEDALKSPLLNTSEVKGAKKILLSLYCSKAHEIKIEEITQVHDFMAKVGDDVTVIWGASFDEELKDEVKITLIATGFDVKDIPGMPSYILEKYQIQSDEQEEEPVVDEEAAIIKKEQENKMEEVMAEIYGETITKNPTAITSHTTTSAKDEDVLIVDIADLDDEAQLEEIEKVPAWKRKRFK